MVALDLRLGTDVQNLVASQAQDGHFLRAYARGHDVIEPIDGSFHVFSLHSRSHDLKSNVSDGSSAKPSAVVLLRSCEANEVRGVCP